MPIIGSWNQTAEVSFYRNLNFSQLKWQNNFFKWIHNAQSNFSVRNFITLILGEFSFKLVASSKILVAMATKVVATWRVARVLDTSTWKIKLLGDPCWCYDLPIWGSIGKVSPWEGERYSSLEIEIIYHNNNIVISVFPRCSLT